MDRTELMATSDKVTTAVRIQAQVNMIQEVMKKVMKKDVHYGIIPGCKKPSLYKPGAEKVMATFRLVADNPIVEDLSIPDAIRYRVTQRILTPDGLLVGSASGECSSDEEKYKWRRPVCDGEFNDTPEDRRREKWVNYQGKESKIKQVRTSPSDVANTILKMAVKRALIAAVLVSTAASDVFDQDIEDLPAGILPEEHQEMNHKPEVAEPQEKKQEQSAPIAEDKPLSVTEAKKLEVGADKFSVTGIIFDFKVDKVGKGLKEITRYTITDEHTNTMRISKWGAVHEGIKEKVAVTFFGVEVSIYKDEKQYLAESVEVAGA